jgi:hypothetical protein
MPEPTTISHDKQYFLNFFSLSSGLADIGDTNMTSSDCQTFTLNNGLKMPKVGLGTWKVIRNKLQILPFKFSLGKGMRRAYFKKLANLRANF